MMRIINALRFGDCGSGESNGSTGSDAVCFCATCCKLAEIGCNKCSYNAEKEHCAKQKEELNEKSIKKHNLGFKDSTLQR